ncbi:hypothetical protein [Kocuria rosea]|uniref:hypothetical protein n=1 Tax=Kocuria rosea TaxID=1275 RepID=UPI0011A2ECC4|nr:hypothetical protein [Kocuria rosea]
MPRPMTLTALMMLVIALIAVVWIYSDPAGVIESRIIFLLWGIGAVLAGISAGSDNLWHRQMANYSQSFGPKGADDRAVTKDLQSTRVVMFIVAAFCSVAGIIGFFIA